jgi:hypothetical protein
LRRARAMADAGAGYTSAVRLSVVPEGMDSLPLSEKRGIIKAVQRGKRVDDPARAGIAVEYAVRYTRWCLLEAVVFLLNGVTSLRGLARGFSWFSLVLGLVSLVGIAFFLYSGTRSRRSLRLNQGLRAEHAVPH